MDLKTDELFREGKLMMNISILASPKHDQPGDAEGGRQGRIRPDAGPARR
jgi:hypothetical protein